MGRTIALFSLGGAPGVTVTALAMGAVWPTASGAVVVEADASGGDIAAWHQLPPSPGVTDLAAATRHRAGNPLSHTQTLPGGLAVCPGPASADPAGGAVELLATNNPALASTPGSAAVGGDTATGAGPPALVVDLGRLTPRSPTAHLLSHADEALLLVGDDVAQLRRVNQSAAALTETVERLRVVVTGGSGRTSEIAAALELPVWDGRIPTDARSAAFLRGEAESLRPARRPLFRAALALARTVSAAVEPATPTPPQPPAQPSPASAHGYAVPEPTSGHRGPDPHP